MTQEQRLARMAATRRRTARVLCAGAASLALAMPIAAAAQPHGGGGGGGGHGGGGGGHGGGAPGGHAGGGGGHAGGLAHVGGAGPAGHGFGAGPPPSRSQFGPGNTFHGYDGSEQRDAHGNFGDRRGFGGEYNSARRFHAGGYDRPDGWYAHRWRHGDILPALFWGADFWLLDYWTYGLSPPPYGYVWVRDDGDALLIDRTTGEVVQVIYGAFY